MSECSIPISILFRKRQAPSEYGSSLIILCTSRGVGARASALALHLTLRVSDVLQFHFRGDARSETWGHERLI
jgi:hypothetical protein